MRTNVDDTIHVQIEIVKFWNLWKKCEGEGREEGGGRREEGEGREKRRARKEEGRGRRRRGGGGGEEEEEGRRRNVAISTFTVTLSPGLPHYSLKAS